MSTVDTRTAPNYRSRIAVDSWRILAVLLFTLLRCAPLSAQAETLENLEALGLEALPKGVSTHFDPGCDTRARRVQGIMEAAQSYFANHLDVSREFVIAVLNRQHWELLEKDFVYGLPFVTSEPHVVFMPCTGGVIADLVLTLPESGLSAIENQPGSPADVADEFVNLIAFHEVSHVYASAYDLPLPTRWIAEFVANYLAYNFMSATDPPSARLWHEISRLAAENLEADHRSLEDFETLYSSVGSSNYFWYQGVFQLMVAPVSEDEGLTFVAKMKRLLPRQVEDCDADELCIAELEDIHPGFRSWAKLHGLLSH